MDDKLTLLAKYNLWDGNTIDTGFQRLGYRRTIDALTGNRVIKILTGQRRAGKSYLLRQTAVKLVSDGVDPKSIFMLDMEFEDFDWMKSDKELNELFRSYEKEIAPEGKRYIFIDEVQNIKGWEKFVNSYSQDYSREYELFLTGSNSKMLSGELSTKISGRYVEIDTYPYSYGEFVEFYGKARNRESYNEYIHSSGMPELCKLEGTEAKRAYTRSLKNTIMLRDIISRHNIRDVALLEDLFKFSINNASNLLSISSIQKYLKGQGRKTSYDTVAEYLGYMEEAFLLYHADRYDIKGKDVIGGSLKYYSNDLCWRNYLYRGFGYGEGYLLENAIFMEIKRHGYEIYVGNMEGKELDFVCLKDDRRIYIQASLSVADEETARREYAPLETIPDNYEKWVVTMDEYPQPSNNGILNIRAWELADLL